MTVVNLKERVIQSGYFVAIINLSDDMGYNKESPFLYYIEGEWTEMEYAEMYSNETYLSKALVESQKSNLVSPDNQPFPVYWKSTINSVNTDSLDAHIRQRRRERALAKLNDEDLIALDLMGDGE